MKNAVLFLLLLSPLALMAQQGSSDDATPASTVLTTVNFPTERVVTPTAADLYCAGFVSKPIGTKHQFVTGGLKSPFPTPFANGEADNSKGHYQPDRRKS